MSCKFYKINRICIMINFRINQSSRQSLYEAQKLEHTEDSSQQVHNEKQNGSGMKDAMKAEKALDNNRTDGNLDSRNTSKVSPELRVSFTLPPTGGVRSRVERGGQIGPNILLPINKFDKLAVLVERMQVKDFEDPSTIVAEQFPGLFEALKILKNSGDPEYETIIEDFKAACKADFKKGPLRRASIQEEAKLRAKQPEDFKGLNQLRNSQNPEDIKKYRGYKFKLRATIYDQVENPSEENAKKINNVLDEIKNIGISNAK